MTASWLIRFRLWRSRWFGPAIGQWQPLNPCHRDGRLASWRLMADGSYEYRPLTADEEAEYVRSIGW
jgi:hypothetical protein